MSVTRVLVANRGEIAVRVIRACQLLGIETVAAVSDADRESMAAQMANRAVCIGPARSTDSYLKIENLMAAAQGTGCDALHPGYGFLSERAALAQACSENNITFIGPSAENISMMGDKLEARKIARAAGVPLVPGSDHARNPREAAQLAEQIGYPLLLKASAGGGGRGIKLVSNANEIEDTFRTAAAEARTAFGNDTLYMEKYVGNARHIEVQILGDQHGNVIHLGERDCSLQRRHQKIVEEAPAYAVPADVRATICTAAATLGAQHRLPQRRHHRVHLRQRHGGFLFSRDEHPHSGRTPGHRNDHRRRSGRPAAAHRSRRAPAVQTIGHPIYRPRHRMPHQRGISATRFSSLPRTDYRMASARGCGYSARYALLSRLFRAALLRFAAR